MNVSLDKYTTSFELSKLQSYLHFITYLIPPSQRTKARFMNQHAMVDWAMKMIVRFDTLNEKEQAFFKDLLAHQKVVKSLSNCLEIS